MIVTLATRVKHTSFKASSSSKCWCKKNPSKKSLRYYCLFSTSKQLWQIYTAAQIDVVRLANIALRSAKVSKHKQITLDSKHHVDIWNRPQMNKDRTAKGLHSKEKIRDNWRHTDKRSKRLRLKQTKTRRPKNHDKRRQGNFNKSRTTDNQGRLLAAQNSYSPYRRPRWHQNEEDAAWFKR